MVGICCWVCFCFAIALTLLLTSAFFFCRFAPLLNRLHAYSHLAMMRMCVCAFIVCALRFNAPCKVCASWKMICAARLITAL